MDPTQLKWNADGLIPVVVQDASDLTVLMLAYMNEDALKETLDTQQATYYSRSRQALWRKGETSGHTQAVKDIRYDCDSDTLLMQVVQTGVACHTGAKSCFYRSFEGDVSASANVLDELYATVASRKKDPVPGSYTDYLFNEGIDKILKKIGEEASEIIIASKNPDDDDLIGEVSDFIYHLTVLLNDREIPFEAIYQRLKERQK